MSQFVPACLTHARRDLQPANEDVVKGRASSQAAAAASARSTIMHHRRGALFRGRAAGGRHLVTGNAAAGRGQVTRSPPGRRGPADKLRIRPFAATARAGAPLAAPPRQRSAAWRTHPPIIRAAALQRHRHRHPRCARRGRGAAGARGPATVAPHTRGHAAVGPLAPRTCLAGAEPGVEVRFRDPPRDEISK